MTRLKRLLATLLLLLSGTASAGDLLLVRSTLTFPETMLNLQSSLSEHGYTVTRVQRVDIGLTSSGFQTDRYRIVFFGKPDEVRRLTAEHPQLIPYLPLSITIFAEGEQTVLTMVNPERLYELAPTVKFAHQVRRWHNDLLSVMDDLREQNN